MRKYLSSLIFLSPIFTIRRLGFFIYSMKYSLIILLFSLAHSSEIDSTRVFRLNDVVVTGTRTAVQIDKLSSTVQIVDSLELAQSNGRSLADKLKNLSGVTLRG